MADYWIVTGKRPFEHASLEAAEQERNRLIALEPERSWRVIRCKHFLKAAGYYHDLVALLRDIARDGLTPLHMARTTDLLASVDARRAAPAQPKDKAA